MPNNTRTCPRCGKTYSSSQSACADCLNAAKRAKRAAAIAERPTVPCVACGTAFKPSSSRHKACSAECQKLNARRVRGTPDIAPKQCGHCAAVFTPTRTDSAFCSERCRERSRHAVRYRSPEYRTYKKNYRVAYHVLNRESRIESAREWRTANREHHRANCRAWSRANPARNLLAKHRRRALKKATQVRSMSPVDVAAKVQYWGGKCWMCSAAADTLDHVKPLAAGGYHMLANLRPACRSCNSAKGAKWYGPQNLSMFIRH